MLMQLGDFPFSIGTAAYSQLSRDSEGRWGSIPLLGGGEAIQFLGRQHDIIVLVGEVYPQISVQVGGDGGTKAIDTLRDMFVASKPLLLQSASGDNLGYWVILKLSNMDSVYLVGGVPRRQRFSLTLKYYGETAE